MSTETPPTRTYPLTLRLAGRRCLVVGGGRVALRKVKGLLGTGAVISVVAPAIIPELETMTGIERHLRPFTPDDLSDAFLVFIATDDPTVNAQILALAKGSGVLVNAADDAAQGDFHLCAVARRGALSIAVSSNGGSPALAAQVRDRTLTAIGPEWETVAEIVAGLRQKELTEGKATAYNSQLVTHLLDAGLPSLAANRDTAAIDRLLDRFINGVTLADLGVELEKGTK